MKPGDIAKLFGIPPNVRDDAEIQTRTLFEKCLEQSFVIAEVESLTVFRFLRRELRWAMS
jgi:hypothetical protein